MRTMLIVLCTTGLRIGEALALQWTDVDLNAGTLAVRRAIQRQGDKGLVFVEPKTALSRRTVQLTDFARDELSQHLKRREHAHAAAGSLWQDGDLVFTSPFGAPMDPSNISHRFQRIREKAGLPPMRLHDLRHTAATLLLQQGVHPSVVREMLGHSTILLTLNTYSHVIPTMHRDAADKMDRLFKPQDHELE
jgi:integrase